MRLAELVETSQRVAARSGRLEKIEHLAACLRHAGADEVECAVAWLSGALRQGRIGVGPAAVRAALEGDAASAPSLEVREVDAALDAIAGVQGPGSGRERAARLGALFARATPDERRFLAPLLVGELRQGALEGVAVEAVARAAGVPAAGVRRALMFEGDLARVAKAAFTEGEPGLARFALQLFRPLQPMLASPAEGVEDALAQLGEAALEWKLDGARVQVHRAGGDVRVFTRRGGDVTVAVPEVVEAAAALPVRELVLDGEVLAFRPDGRPQPFQVTMRRFGRKLDVEALRDTLPLRPYFFDVLWLDGESWIDRPGAERGAALAEALPETLVVPRRVTDDTATATAFLRDALAAGHEGVMAKSLAAPYAAGSRGRDWLKLKPVHTLDLVVLAAEWGHGRRRGWLSNLHLGARDAASGAFVMLGKTFKGLTDEMLAWQTKELLARETRREGGTVHVRPELVAEVAFNEVQASPHYPGGMALRFARVKRYRPDKGPEQADTLDTVKAIAAGEVSLSA